MHTEKRCSEECLARQRQVESAMVDAIKAANRGNPAMIVRHLQEAPVYEHSPNCPAKGTTLPMDRVVELKRRSLEQQPQQHQQAVVPLRCSDKCLRFQDRAVAARDAAMSAAIAGDYALSAKIMDDSPASGHHRSCPVVVAARRRHTVTTVVKLPPGFAGRSITIGRSVVPRRERTPPPKVVSPDSSTASSTAADTAVRCSPECRRMREQTIINRAIDVVAIGDEELMDNQGLDEELRAADHLPTCPAVVAAQRKWYFNVRSWWLHARFLCCIPSASQPEQ